MTEAILITIILLNIALILGREDNGYNRSLFATICFVLGVPVACLSLAFVFLASGPLVFSLLAGTIAVINILHTLSIMAGD